jgi:hypothetical protein
MKKNILFLCLSLLIVSCNSNEHKMKTGIKNYLDKNAKDPKSYEFVELKVIDTVTAGEIAKHKIEFNNEILKVEAGSLTLSKENLQKAIGYKKQFNDNDFDEDIIGSAKEVKEAETAIEQCKKENKHYAKWIDSKEVLGYIAIHKCRLKNGYGALDLTEYYVEFDKNFNLLAMDKDINHSVFELK